MSTLSILSKDLLFVLLIFFSSLYGNESQAKEIRVAAVEAGQRGFIDSDGNVRGSSVEITNSVLKRAGYTPINKIMPFPRILHSLEVGAIDAALLVTNDKVTQLAIPLVHLQDVEFIVVPKRGLELNNLEDLGGLSVGYLRSSRISEQILSPLIVEQIEGDKYIHILQMLKHGRLDALVGAKYTIEYAMHELGYTPGLFSTPLLVKRLELHLVYSKKNANEDIMKALTDAAKSLKAENVIQAIINRYHPDSFEKQVYK